MFNFGNQRFFGVLIVVLAISAFATVYSQNDPEEVLHVLLVGYGALFFLSVLGGICMSAEVWWVASASTIQAIGYLKTGKMMDALSPLQVGLQTIVVVGILPQLIDKRANLRRIVLILLALAAVNYLASETRHDIDLFADNRTYSNMIGGYGMFFAVLGFCLTGWTGMVGIIAGGIILMLTSCRSAILGTILGCSMSALFRYRQFDRKFIRFNMLALLCLPLVAIMGWNRLHEEGHDAVKMQLEHFLSRDSARSEVWGEAETAGLKSPWLGLGQYTSDSQASHNVWLASFKAGGILSCVCLICAQIVVLRKLYLVRTEFWGSLSLAWFTAILTRSMFEGGTGVFPATGTNWIAVCTMFALGISLRLEPEENRKVIRRSRTITMPRPREVE